MQYACSANREKLCAGKHEEFYTYAMTILCRLSVVVFHIKALICLWTRLYFYCYLERLQTQERALSCFRMRLEDATIERLQTHECLQRSLHSMASTEEKAPIIGALTLRWLTWVCQHILSLKEVGLHQIPQIGSLQYLDP